MVQLSGHTPRPLGRGVSALSLLTGLGAVVLGVALLGESESAFGATWASLFVVLGVVVLVSLVAVLRRPPGSAPVARPVTLEGEPARFFPRDAGRSWAAGLAAPGLLGGWFAVLGVVGAIEESRLWPVLAAVPAAYFLGFPVLAALGRFRVGGTWLTATRVVDEHSGLRSELRLTEVGTVTPRSRSVHVAPVRPDAVVHRRLTPWPWRARPRTGDLVLVTDGHPGTGEELAAEVRAAVAAARR